MDLAPLISKIEQRVSGAVLERQRFGRTQVPCVWIEAKKLREVAALLREDREAGLTWLEHLGAAQIDDSIVLSYFVRSMRGREEVVLRLTLEPEKGKLVEVPSVREIWPMAASQEDEVGELFGIKFGAFGMKKELVSGDEFEFPLRKDTEWPRL